MSPIAPRMKRCESGAHREPTPVNFPGRTPNRPNDGSCGKRVSNQIWQVDPGKIVPNISPEAIFGVGGMDSEPMPLETNRQGHEAAVMFDFFGSSADIDIVADSSGEVHSNTWTTGTFGSTKIEGAKNAGDSSNQGANGSEAGDRAISARSAGAPIDKKHVSRENLSVADFIERYMSNMGGPPKDSTSNHSTRSADARPAGCNPSKTACLPKEADCLLGRGGLSNRHLGNKRYRTHGEEFKPYYVSCKKVLEKRALSQLLVEYVHAYGGRFLRKNTDGEWFEVDNRVARKKASQLLRE